LLPANLSTGYSWKIVGTPDAGLVQSVGQNYIAEQPVLPSSGGVGVWTFSALTPGNTTQADETVIF